MLDKVKPGLARVGNGLARLASEVVRNLNHGGVFTSAMESGMDVDEAAKLARERFGDVFEVGESNDRVLDSPQ